MTKDLNIIVAVLDDHQPTVDLIEAILKANTGTNYKLYTDPEKLLSELTNDLHICIIDHFLGSHLTGFDVVKMILNKNKSCWIIVMSGSEDLTILKNYVNNARVDYYLNKNDEDFLHDLAMGLQNGLLDIREDVEFWNKYLSDEPGNT